ncbi:MAG: AbrB/MazE/SpoVT family DNA-binding domain-containing protein [Elusimicrobia bacterium]|nr:AbrB/MazE/SpoVT family DNA-binding domain-containing protein [Elusimicrobiota bacterium]
MSPMGAKAQVTLPKAVRQTLGLSEKDMVGFVVDGKRVALTRIEPVPSSDPFSEEEWRKIERLAGEAPAAAFPDSKASLRYLKGLLR